MQKSTGLGAIFLLKLLYYQNLAEAAGSGVFAFGFHQPVVNTLGGPNGQGLTLASSGEDDNVLTLQADLTNALLDFAGVPPIERQFSVGSFSATLLLDDLRTDLALGMRQDFSFTPRPSIVLELSTGQTVVLDQANNWTANLTMPVPPPGAAGNNLTLTPLGVDINNNSLTNTTSVDITPSVTFTPMDIGASLPYVGGFDFEPAPPLSVGDTFSVPVYTSSFTLGGFNTAGTQPAFNLQGFTYPVPTLISISPTGGNASQAPLSLTVHGNNFFPTHGPNSSSVILINGAPHFTTYVDANTLTTTLSATDLSSSLSISVRNPSPGGGVSASKLFTAPGPVSAWGNNSNGQLGNNSITSSSLPVVTQGLSSALAVAAGNNHSLALMNNATVYSWGANGSGQLGLGSTTDSHVPVQVSGLSGITDIAAGDNSSLALDSNVQATQKTVTTTTGDITPGGLKVGVQIPSSLSFLQLLSVSLPGDLPDSGFVTDYSESGDIFTPVFIIDYQFPAGAPCPFDSSSSDFLGDQSSLGPVEVTYVQVLSGPNAGVAITSLGISPSELRGLLALFGNTQYCGTQTNSSTVTVYSPSIWGFGDNGPGGLGTGNQNQEDSPTPVVGVNGAQYLDGAALIAAGAGHSLALMSNGTVMTWGNGYYGELGNGQSGNGVGTTVPLPVNGLSNVTAIAAGGTHDLAVDTSGHVWAWGNNSSGQLGNGGTTNASTPDELPDISNVVSVAGGNAFSLALKGDGSAWAWGDNSHGQLGDGNAGGYSTTPVQIHDPSDPSGYLTHVVAIAAGDYHSLALKGDGSVWAWGDNGYGQLGDGTTSDRDVPVLVKGTMNIVAIAAGRNHSLAVGLVDQTSPTTNAGLDPGANSAGWNNTPVNVILNATDPGGLGVASVTYSESGAQTVAATTLSGAVATVPVTTEGITKVTYYSTDVAGNPETPKTITVHLDETAALTTDGVTPAPNAAGWNDTTPTVTLSAIDPLLHDGNPGSGVLSLTYSATPDPTYGGQTIPTTTSVNASPSAGYGATVPSITVEGISTLGYFSTDVAGNVETTKQRIVRLDRTPPECYLELDPKSQDVVVFGVDPLSGPAAGTSEIAPSSVVAVKWDEDSGKITPVAKANSASGKDSKDEAHDPQLRTYEVYDVAGNELVLTLVVKAAVVSLQYTGAGVTGPLLTASANSISDEWSLDEKTGSLKELEQDLTLGKEDSAQELQAHYNAKQGETQIQAQGPGDKGKETKPVKVAGLVLLKLSTSQGMLKIGD